MNYSMQHIQKSLKILSHLKPARPRAQSKSPLSLKDTILFMAPKLLAMKEQGFSTKELSEALAAQEIVIKAATLNRYLCQYQQKQAPTAESEQAAEVMPPTTSVEAHSTATTEAQSRLNQFGSKSTERVLADPHEV